MSDSLKTFNLKHKIFKTIQTFTEDNAPKWLCEGGRAGSTMDNRWFWNDYVLKLNVGQKIDTDFHVVKRIG